MSEETIAAMRKDLQENGLLQHDFELVEALQVIEIDIALVHKLLKALQEIDHIAKLGNGTPCISKDVQFGLIRDIVRETLKQE